MWHFQIVRLIKQPFFSPSLQPWTDEIAADVAIFVAPSLGIRDQKSPL